MINNMIYFVVRVVHIVATKAISTCLVVSAKQQIIFHSHEIKVIVSLLIVKN